MSDSFGLLPYTQDQYEAFDRGDYKGADDYLGDLEEMAEAL